MLKKERLVDSLSPGIEAWNRVSMIAPVKKFSRARLSTGFVGKKTWWTSLSGKRL